MTRSITIRIDGRPPTPNARRHWRGIATDNARWKEIARQATADALPPGWTPLTRCRMTVEFIVPDRRDRDDDNLIAAQKPVVDGIVRGGAIANDSRRVIVEREYLGQTYRKGEQGAVYVITEVAA